MISHIVPYKTGGSPVGRRAFAVFGLAKDGLGEIGDAFSVDICQQSGSEGPRVRSGQLSRRAPGPEFPRNRRIPIL